MDDTGRHDGRRLSELTGRLASAARVGDAEVNGIAVDSREAAAGDLFVALPGTRADGHAFLAEAVARGAAAVCVERDPPAGLGVPVVRVASTRRVLAELAAAWHGDPARRLTLVGITGTVGKTSTLTMLDAALRAAGARTAAIGSLGVRIAGEPAGSTAHTTPDPLVLHGWLRRIADAGCTIAAMEVSSHALVQGRVHGLGFDLGVFTNLLPLEHSDFHASFRDYVEAKRRFVDHLRDCAPLVYNADDRVVRRIVHAAGLEPVGCGTARSAVARLIVHGVAVTGSDVLLELRRALRRVRSGAVGPLALPLHLPLLGRANLANAGMAACAALLLGAAPADVAAALSALPAPRRRLQVLHAGDFTVLDDTVGHPDSISALFEVVNRLGPARVHVVWAVRGSRGTRINRASGEALAVWLARVRAGAVVVTRSRGSASARDVVADAEQEAFLAPLHRSGVVPYVVDCLDDAVRHALACARSGDLVLLLGAQGMDEGARIAGDWLRDRGLATP